MLSTIIRSSIKFGLALSLLISFQGHAKVQPSQQIFYTSPKNPLQSLDLYPGPGATSPLLVFVHGGAWVSGDKQDFAELALNFQDHFSVAIINYRLSPAIKHPSHVEDLVTALKILHHEKNISPTKLVLMGHSAGAFNIAYLATQLELLKISPKISGFIGLDGIYDLPALAETWPGYDESFLNKAFGVNGVGKVHWKNFSPTLLPLQSKVPWLLVHSAEDELVDLKQSENFQIHLEKSGIKSKLLVLKKLSHSDVVTSLRSPETLLSRQVLNFINSLEN